MDYEKFKNAMQFLKIEALEILETADLMNDTEAQEAILAIQNAFDEMGVEIEEVIPDEVVQSYFKGYEEAAHMMGMEDVIQAIREDGTVDPRFNRMIHTEAVEEVTDDILMDLTAAVTLAKESAAASINTVRNTMKKGISERLIRGIPKREVVRRVQEAFLKEGMTAFYAKDGSRMELDYYARMVTFTKLSEVENTGHLNRYDQNDIDLVEIITNDPTCEICARHRGLVYSRTGKTPGFPILPEKLIPFHPHCQCSYAPIDTEFMTEDELEALRERQKHGVYEEDPRSEREKEQYDKFQGINRRNNAEKKLYMRMITHLGADMPLSLPAFRRMKRQNTEKYKELYSNYLSATHTKAKS